MKPAPRVPELRDGVRLLVLQTQPARVSDAAAVQLPCWLDRGDVLVVNDAATLPASLHGVTARGDPIELRLLGLPQGARARAVLLGAGDYHTKTEHRPAPPALHPGAVLYFAELRAQVVAPAPLSPRLLELDFDREGEALLAALYRLGRPVQYAHHADALPLYELQTVYGGRPWAVEMPSAGRPLCWSALLALRARGVRVVALTHAAGLSATGDPAIDAALPLPERFEIPAEAVDAIQQARAEGGRVIAVGTSVVRALEGSAELHGGVLQPGAGETSLILDQHSPRRVVDALLTGMHEPGESHFKLLRAFAPAALLASAHAHAAQAGYHSHEFGDWMLIVAPRIHASTARCAPSATALSGSRAPSA
jgi:S-adenosylmethionine:tRNA ribosyltransferase-isomerase